MHVRHELLPGDFDRPMRFARWLINHCQRNEEFLRSLVVGGEAAFSLSGQVNLWNVCHYSDDTNLIYSAKDISTIQFNLNEDLQNVNEWLISNKLTLNLNVNWVQTSSKYFFGKLLLEINGIPLGRVSTTKLLGFLLDENFTWNSNIDKMTKRIASAIGAIKRLR